jgi:MSHA biogenesis protein MshQ
MSLSQSVSEVGVFRFTATPPLYMGYALPVAKSAPVGRFTPNDFVLSNGSVTPGCGSFSYMGQPMPTSFTVTARNSSGGTTRNYRDEFAPGLVSLVAENNDNGLSLSSRLSGLGVSNWQQGVFAVNNYPETFARLSTPDGPFSQLAIGVSVADNEPAVDIPLQNQDMDVLSSGSCGGACTAVRIGVQDLRYGRLRLGSGRAAVNSPLALALTMESYSGGQWLRNGADNCTALDLKFSGGFIFDRSYDVSRAELTMNDNSAKSRLALNANHATPSGQPTSATAQAGYIWLHFTAPGISDRVNYQLDLSKQPSQPNWLSFDWSGDGTATVADMGGWAFFNQWRSSDRVIYRREVLN